MAHLGPERKHLSGFVTGVAQTTASKLTYSLKFCILYFTTLLHYKKPGEGLIPQVFGLKKNQNGLVRARVVALEQGHLKSTCQDKVTNLKRHPPPTSLVMAV